MGNFKLGKYVSIIYQIKCICNKEINGGREVKIYMASYLLDAIYEKYDFEGLGLKWSPQEELPVNIHFKRLWNMGCKWIYENIV